MVSLALLATAALCALHAARIDSETFRLPNRLNLAIGFCNAMLLVVWASVASFRPEIALQWGLLLVGHLAVAVLPGNLLGLGDVKLIAALAPVMLWWQGVGLWLMLAYVSATVTVLARRTSVWRERIAFGPYLVGAWLFIVMGQLARVAMAYCR